jgi:5-methylcytosine-specific restriction protein A
MNYPSSAYSWDVLSDDVAIKHMDKSSFLHHGTGIPREIASFFELPENGLLAPKPIQLMLGTTIYEAHIHMDAANSRYRLFWKTDFADQLIERFPYIYRKHALNEEYDDENPVMRFERTQQDLYRIALIESATSHEDIDPKTIDWTDQELEAAIYAYFTMLNKELRAKKYNKAEANRQLRSFELINRSRGSVEFRMQNISSVLQQLCHPIIQGYLPRMIVGSDVSERIKKIIFSRKFLNERDYSPTADKNELDKRVGSLLGKKIIGIPKGQRNSKKQQSSQTAYESYPLVKAWVLQNANGTCELCKKPGPFRNKLGEWFLEEHHVISLADGGSDIIENTVALCPNCHRKCHLSPETDKVQKELRNTIERIE